MNDPLSVSSTYPLDPIAVLSIISSFFFLFSGDLCWTLRLKRVGNNSDNCDNLNAKSRLYLWDFCIRRDLSSVENFKLFVASFSFQLQNHCMNFTALRSNFSQRLWYVRIFVILPCLQFWYAFCIENFVRDGNQFSWHFLNQIFSLLLYKRFHWQFCWLI